MISDDCIKLTGDVDVEFPPQTLEARAASIAVAAVEHSSPIGPETLRYGGTLAFHRAKPERHTSIDSPGFDSEMLRFAPQVDGLPSKGTPEEELPRWRAGA
ncbi:hypothetical protein N7539_000787 [Penicillium diatomitis]|uniref:Uncharacterized protein n=1 Tax=Penicillium diatomitis TaxID=2819901 RepID=A0A9X0C2N9_9EURO|nr:uncharacterized protein N7539_000787 [Penicillium diatomitis]KAJ5495671.1 hypothetical protein N7539_000787 [Penicillium diatomitis]